MSDVYLQPISSSNKNNQHYDNIDLCNEDTFGAGAIEGDWELDHAHHVGLQLGESWKGNANDIGLKSGLKRDLSDDLEPFNFDSFHSPSQLDDDELERSNQQLAAAVEELVLNSDQDQDMLDPAIVSLRRQPQTTHLAASPKLPPLYSCDENQMKFNHPNISTLFSRPDNLYTSDNMKNIWNESSLGQSILTASLSMPVDNKPSNENGNLQFEDEAILSVTRETSEFDRPDLLSSPLVVSAEDLERELQSSASPRGPSPTYGISIPHNGGIDPVDRSLPPRSVSPLFGSPSPSNMPIGTPPKHVIMNMMHHLEQQHSFQNPPKLIRPAGSSGSVPHPPLKFPPGLPPPRLPPFMSGPHPLINGGAQMGMPPPPPKNVIWPRQPSVNPLIAHDIMNRLGMRQTPPPNLASPIGSPIPFPGTPPHLINRPRMPLPQGGARQGPRRQIPIFGNGRLMPPAPVFGPGHLHPEHSKFVRMRQQNYGGRDSMGRPRNYKRPQYHEERIGIPGDPYANIMNQKEKDWVIRIQMMALQSDRPEIDDYYYQNFIERRLREGRLASGSSKPQRLITPTKPNLENRKYVPVQFSNSLGKLTTSSVYNPRQIIDIIQSSNQDEDQTTSEGPDTRQALSKRLVVYKTIEKAYEIIVLMEELQTQIEMCPPNASARQSFGNNLDSKTRMMLEVLGMHDDKQFDLHDDPIFQVMKIRKGKKLIARCLHFLPQTHAITVVQSIFSHLAILIKRDAKDGVLHELYSPISDVLTSLDSSTFLQLSSLLSTFAITAAVKDQVGVSIVCKLLYEGSVLFDSGQAVGIEHWQKFVSDVSDIMVAVANPREGSRHARPTTPSPLLENFPYQVFEVLSKQPTEKHTSEKIKSSVQQLISSTSFEAQ